VSTDAIQATLDRIAPVAVAVSEASMSPVAPSCNSLGQWQGELIDVARQITSSIATASLTSRDDWVLAAARCAVLRAVHELADAHENLLDLRAFQETGPPRHEAMLDDSLGDVWRAAEQLGSTLDSLRHNARPPRERAAAPTAGTAEAHACASTAAAPATAAGARGRTR